MPNKWEIADRISDRIVDVINDELRQMKERNDIQPLQLLAGQLLAYKALERIAGLGIVRPPELRLVSQSVNICLNSLMKT